MNFEFSKHALEQMNLRNISKEVVNEILNSPHHIKEMGDFKVYQSVEQDKKHLIRILSIQIIWFLQFTEHRKSKSTMKVKYDKETDVLYIGFSEEKIQDSDEDKPGIILDYDKNGVIVGIEILKASKKMNPSKVEYEVA